MKTKNMWYTFCFGAFLLAMLLVGCRAKPVGGNVPQTAPATLNTFPHYPSTAPTTSPVTESTEPTKETEPPPTLEPVTLLTSVKWRTVPQLLSLGEGKVLACRNYYEEGKGIVNLLDIVNVYEDKVLYQKQIDTPRELVDQQFTDGCFVLRDSKDNTFYVYDQTLQLTDRITAPNVDGWFSHDRKNYYFVDDNVLYQMDVNSGTQSRMTLDYDLRLESLIGIHPDRDIIVARFYISFYNQNCGVCAIDCSTGKLVLLNKTVSHLWFDGNTFYAAVTNNQVYGSDICYGSLDGGVLQMASASLLGSDTVSYTMLPGSGILMHRSSDDTKPSTTVYDLSNGGICSQLIRHNYSASTLGCIYLRQEQLIFGVYADNYDFSPVVIDPRVLSYEKSLNIHKENWPALIDRNVILAYQAEAEGPVVPANLLTLRQQADALEKKYGVKILIENQTLGHCGSYAAVSADEGKIANALTALDQALALYPKDFLKQFQNGIGEGGLYFFLTGRIQGSLDPVGKALKNGNRYELTLDISAEKLDHTIHHELWHAIEMKLSTDRFNHPRWHTINPQGFLYYGHYDKGYQHLTQWTYQESGDQCYFVDAYARINPREDRARLMEYVMATDASDLLESPALQQKLEIISKTIRDNFDTRGWQTPHWERYL